MNENEKPEFPKQDCPQIALFVLSVSSSLGIPPFDIPSCGP